MAKTLHDRYVAALLARGSEVTPFQPSRKYTRLTHPSQHDTYYFVGRAGAVRRGSYLAVSFAATDTFKYRLLCEAELSKPALSQ